MSPDVDASAVLCSWTYLAYIRFLLNYFGKVASGNDLFSH